MTMIEQAELTRHQFVRGAIALVGGAAAAWLPLTSAGRTTASIPRLRRRPLSAYSIVIPDRATQVEQQAAERLCQYLGRILGRSIVPITKSARSRGPAIFVGNTGSTADHPDRADLPRDEGFAIVPTGNDLIVAGGTARGTLNAVYALLRLWGFRLYAPGVMRLPGVSELGVPVTSTRVSPRIGYRTTSYRGAQDAEYADWHHLSSPERWGLFVHTFNDLVPPGTYGATDPEFYSLIAGRRVPGTQLCLSNSRMRDVLITNLAKMIAAKPDATYWSVSQNDNDQYCRCADCMAIDARYGGVPSGSILHFVNGVAKAFPQKTISTLAYWYSRTAPKGLRADPNVNIMLCNIESRRQAPVFVTDPDFSRDLTEWGRIAGDILIWDYNIQFTNLVSPFPNLHTIKPNIQFYANNGVTALFMQANDKVGGEFAELRAYLISTLMWDPNVDDDAVIDEFLLGYYGAAAPHLRRYIDAMRQSLEASDHRLDIFGSPEGAQDAYLTASAITLYKTFFDQAARVVADRSEYLRRVDIARLPIMYAELQIGRNQPVDSERGMYVRGADGCVTARPEMIALVDRFTSGCEEAGISRLRERSTSPADYRASYRRIFSELAAVKAAKSLSKAVSLRLKAASSRDTLRRLTDGLFGSWESWSAPDPNWVMFSAEHIDVILDLGELTEIRKIEMTFLNAQAQPDWNTLVLPQFVEFTLSENGQEFLPWGRVDNPHDPNPKVNPRISDVPIHVFRHESDRPARARYIGIFARSMLRMPSWHLLPGRAAVISTDQIVVT